MAESKASITVSPSGKEYKRTRRSSDFACILYPEEDENHKAIFEYITSLPSPLFVGYAWILHDKDLLEPTEVSTPEGDEVLYNEFQDTKKNHIHMYFKVCKQSTVAGIRKHFDNKVYLQVVDFPEAYLLYVLHRDFKSLQDPLKHQYDYEELHLTKNFEKIAFSQKGNFVSNFDFIFNSLRSGNSIESTFYSARQILSDMDFETFLRDFRLYQYLFIHMETEARRNVSKSVLRRLPDGDLYE